VLVGEPSQPGPYVIRVKVPSGVILMPHRHPEDRIYTVMSGVFYIGLGDQFDGHKVKAYPPGCVVVLPGGPDQESTSHRSRRSGRLVSNMWMRTTIRGARGRNWPSHGGNVTVTRLSQRSNIGPQGPTWDSSLDGSYSHTYQRLYAARS
jgi:hypothetical protein